MQVVRDHRVETRRIKTGLAAGALAEVREGLSEGDLVVARSGTFLRDGDAVRPRAGDKAKHQRGAAMNWNISAWSIRQPVPSLVLFMVLIALGYVSFGQLPVTRFPNIDVPIVQVRVYQSGAAPSELEVQVTKKIEDAIAGVNGVKHQTSAVTEGSSVTTIEFRLEVNQDRALNDVKDAIARIRAELPRTIDEPIVTRIEIEGLPIVTYSARAPGMTPEELSWFVDDTVVRALQGVKGVSQIERFGGVEREIRVALDPDRLLAYRHHRRRRQPAAAGHQRRPGRRARRDRRARAGDPHARRQAVGGGPRRHHDRAAAGPQGAPRPAGHRDRRHGRAAHLCRARRQARGGVRHLARQGRERRRSWPPTWPRRSASCRRRIPTSS